MPEYFNTNTHPFLQAASTVGNIVVLYHDEEGSIYIGASGGGGGGTPGGSDTQVQFNDGGSFGGDSGFTFNKTTDSAALLGNMSASGFISTGETANTIASFDGNKKLTSLPTATYPSLTELTYLKGAYADMNDFIELSYLRSLYNLVYR